MADKKITELTNITGVNLVDADEFVVVDISADETKAITLGELKNAFDTGSGFVRITGDTMTGDLSFGDNDKAIFGAGSDLQIFHLSANNASYIQEQNASASLNIDGTDVYIRSYPEGDNMIIAERDGAVTLHYDDSPKLATTSTGVDITGTLTSDSLTVDNAGTIQLTKNTSAYQDSLGIVEFHDEDGSASADAGKFQLQAFRGGDKDAPDFKLIGSDSTGVLRDRIQVEGNGDISFYEDTGTTAKFFWDSSQESLGIGAGDINLSGVGTNSQNVVTTIQGNNQFRGILELANATGVSSVDGSAGDIAWFDNDNKIAQISALGQDTTNHDDGDLAFSTATGGTLSEAMRISATGSVAIGTGSPSDKFHVDGAGAFVRVNRTDGEAGITLMYNGSNSTRSNIVTATNGDLIIDTANSEAMRINASGRVLIGTSEIDVGFTDSGSGVVVWEDGLFQAARSSAYAVGMFNKLDNDGQIVEFYKDGGLVGSIGTRSGRLKIGDGDVGLFFDDVNNRINPEGPSNTSANDASIDLGGASQRFKDLHLSGEVKLPNCTLADQVIKSNTFIFQNGAGSTEYGRFDSSGNLLVGTLNTAAGAGNSETGISLRGGTDNRSFFSVDQDYVMHLNRKGNNGNIVEFANDGANVGSIGSQSGPIAAYLGSSYATIGAGDTGIFFSPDNDHIVPVTATSSATRGDAIDLGASGGRFKDLYLSGGVYLGGTGAANKLDDYEEGTWTPEYNDGQDFTVGSTAVYRKVGNLVWVNFDVTGVSGRSSSTINNLPFTSSSTGGNFSGYTGYETLSTTSPIYSHMNANSSYVQLYVGSSSVSINAGERYIGAVVYATD